MTTATPSSSGARPGGKQRHRKRHRGQRARQGQRRTHGQQRSAFDLAFLKTPPSQEKFYTEENMQDIHFGFQDSEVIEDDKMKQIYGIIHGQLGHVDIPENKDDYAGVRGDIVYYCKDCEKLVEPKKHPKRPYVFLCNTCGGEHVCWGTEQGISTHFHIRGMDTPRPVKRDPGN